MKRYFAFLVFAAIHVHATTLPDATVKPPPPTCVAELFAHESWVAARMAEVADIRFQFDAFRQLKENDGQITIISSSADTIVEVQSLDVIDRHQMNSEVRAFKGIPFDPTLGNAVRMTLKSRAALDAFTWFMTARDQSWIYDYMEKIRAVRLKIVIEAPTGRRTTQLAVFRKKPDGLLQLARSRFTPPERVVLLDERRVRAHISADGIADYLIDGEAHRSNDDFGQTSLAIRAIREQMGVDLERLDTFFEDTASIAARELLQVAAYEFDPFATDHGYFRPSRQADGVVSPADQDFFKKSIGALRVLGELSYVWIDPRRAAFSEAPVPPGPLGWVTREDYARWTAPNLKSGFIDRSLSRFEGFDRATILVRAIETVQGLGYEWHGGWVKRHLLK